MVAVPDFLGKLRGVEKAASGWKALCPAHDDSKPSLSIAEGNDGKILINCFAGCKAREIVAAIGLEISDLFAAPAAQRARRSELEAIYQYRDLDGIVHSEVCRYRDAQGGKIIRQRRYHEGKVVWGVKKGKYRWESHSESYRRTEDDAATEGVIDLPAVEQILYRLPEIQDPIANGDWIIVTEGEKDADIGAGIELATTTKAGGAGSQWLARYSKMLQKARVAIVPDRDEAGRICAERIAAKLSAQGNDVRILNLEGSSPGYDLANWIADQERDGLDKIAIRQALLAMIENAPSVVQTTTPDKNQGSPNRQVIRLTHNQKEAGDQAVTLLSTRPEFYRRGGKLVQIVTDDSAVEGNESADSSAVSICTVTQARLLEILSDCSDWVSSSGRRCAPPDWLARTIMGRPSWDGIRRLDGLVGFPILRQDGTIREDPGYDPQTELYYSPNCSRIPFPPAFDAAAAREAAQMLRGVVCDFPFATDVDLGVLVAAMLTIVGRSTFQGPSPLFVVNANVAGSGKSLLVDVVSVIAMGTPAPRMAQATQEDEERKRITSLLLAGESLALIDNVNRPLGSAPLDAVLTSTIWSDRRLGSNDQIKQPLRFVIFATGNNVKIVGDTNRRYLAIQLYADGRPDRRSDFEHPQLLAWIKANRPTLLASAITILASYLRSGRPNLAPDSWGSYEGWSAVIRNAVLFAGLGDPCDARDALEEASDPEETAIIELLTAWRRAEIAVGSALTVRTILDLPETDEAVDLRLALCQFCGVRSPRQLGAREIGNRLKNVRDRDFSGLVLEQVGSKGEHGIVWTVVDNYSPPDW